MSLKFSINFAIVCSVFCVIDINGQDFPQLGEIGNYGEKELLNLDTIDMIQYITEYCSKAVAQNNALPDFGALKLTLYDGKRNPSFFLHEMGNLLKHPSFNATHSVVIFVTGWLSNLEEKNPNAADDELYRAYKCRGSTNFLTMDTSKQVNTLAASTAENTFYMGQYLANAIRDITGSVSINQVHLLGHSLGAHVAGAAGRFFKAITGKTLPRITGLDPGRVCFFERNGMFDLERSDADFVDIIHTDSNSLGKEESIGHVNFYPDGLDGLGIMFGCHNIICSHKMAWRYYAESVYPGNENGFVAQKCKEGSNVKNLSSTECSGQSIPMGYATPPSAAGTFFLVPNSKAPYGKDSRKDIKCSGVQATQSGDFDDRPVWD